MMNNIPNEILEEIFSYLLSEAKFYITIRSLNLKFKNFADKHEEMLGRVIHNSNNKLLIDYIDSQPDIINLHYIKFVYDNYNYYHPSLSSKIYIKVKNNKKFLLKSH